jgi:hypothetical protein
MSLISNITSTPGNPPTYNPSMAETFSWIPIEGAGRPLFAKATYSVNTPSQNGFVITTDTAVVTGNFCAIKMITNTAFSGLTADNSTIPSLAITFPANFVLEGPIKAYRLSTGSVIAVKA